MQIAFSIVLPKKRDLEKTKILESEKDSDLFDFYQKNLSEEKTIKSRFGYSLRLYYFRNPSSNKLVVLSHGHTYTHHGCIKYARMMSGFGYNVVMYDQRFHGNSEGKNTTLGYYEKFDLFDIITVALVDFEGIKLLGTYGESMGAATVIQEKSIDERVDFCISDCAFCDLSFLIKEKIKARKLPKFIYLFIDLFVKAITGVRMREISPINDLERITIPILFIHGKQDEFIGYWHTEKMYEKYNGDKEIFLADNNATHAMSYFAEKKEYEEKVKVFIRRFE
jgi:hypothetical protein